MVEKKEFRNIRAGIAFTSAKELRIAASGERHEDYEKQFHDLFFDIISGAITHGKWGVHFTQIGFLSEFVVDIYTDNIQDFTIIYNIISKNGAGDIKLQMMQPYWEFQKFLELTKQQTPDR